MDFQRAECDNRRDTRRVSTQHKLFHFLNIYISTSSCEGFNPELGLLRREVLRYLLLGEVLRAELKLLILGFHGFAQFLKNLRIHSQPKGATVRMNIYAAVL